MEIEKLSKNDPLLNELIWESEYVKILPAKELTITLNSDVNLLVKVIFSIDGVHDGHENKFKIQSGWSSRCIRRSLPYCKVVIENDTMLPNEILCLSVISDKTFKEEKVDPNLVNKADELDLHEEHRSKSPFRSLLSKRRKSVPRQAPQVQMPRCKVPEHVPKNGLICGEWNGDMKVIPPPIGNIPDMQILCFQDNKFEWIILSDDTGKGVGWRFD